MDSLRAIGILLLIESAAVTCIYVRKTCWCESTMSESVYTCYDLPLRLHTQEKGRAASCLQFGVRLLLVQFECRARCFLVKKYETSYNLRHITIQKGMNLKVVGMRSTFHHLSMGIIKKNSIEVKNDLTGVCRGVRPAGHSSVKVRYIKGSYM